MRELHKEGDNSEKASQKRDVSVLKGESEIIISDKRGNGQRLEWAGVSKDSENALILNRMDKD